MITDGDIPAGESTAAQAVGADLTKHFEFLRDISTETGNTVLSRMPGYAFGYGTAKLEDGDLAAAAKQLGWLVQESSRYEGVPGSSPRR
ncbi:hypothetical protein ABT224_20395 [Streptomyces sp. NPDC001584]|uniref:hypothetical protein n=1 Tax=Streptomyces sp. NPDC001584 TaxID=3154521 RepID=UPI003334277B